MFFIKFIFNQSKKNDQRFWGKSGATGTILDAERRCIEVRDGAISIQLKKLSPRALVIVPLSNVIKTRHLSPDNCIRDLDIYVASPTFSGYYGNLIYLGEAFSASSGIDLVESPEYCFSSQKENKFRVSGRYIRNKEGTLLMTHLCMKRDFVFNAAYEGSLKDFLQRRDIELRRY